MANSIEPLSSSLHVAVLFGGDSAEREISLMSGRAVAQALSSRGFQITMMDPAEMDLDLVEWSVFDAAFIALHGRYGEDGEIQKLLDRQGIPYTSSSAEVCSLTFSKSATKERLIQAGVPTPPYVLIHETDDAARIQAHARLLGFPLVVKPDTQGSSLGVSIVETPEDLPAALARCFHLDSFGLLERFIPGTEWTAGFMNRQQLPLIQIRTPRGFYDYRAKYEDHQTDYCFDFEVTSDVVRRIEHASQQAVACLGTTGLARLDLRVDQFDNPWVLEINTVPGFTDHSLVPKAAARIGIDFPSLCERIVRTSLDSVSTS